MSEELIRRVLGAEIWPALIAFGAALARVGVAVWIAPFLGGKLVPASVKLALSALLSLVLVPALIPHARALAAAPAPALAAVIAKEALVGAALGFVVATVFWAAQAAGRLADTVRGANMAEALIPQERTRSSPLGSLLFQLTVVMFIALDGHHIFVTTLGASYQALPLAVFPGAVGLGGFAALCGRLTADVLLISLSLAAPVVGATFLADLTLGVINRFTPQINVFFLAMPAKAMIGILMLVLSVGVLMAALPPLLGQAVRNVGRALAILAG